MVTGVTLKDVVGVPLVVHKSAIERRTLSRHLRMEGLAFRQVADGIRFEFACGLLENTDMALGQIAAILRYSEPSAFTRAFRRWSGQTPSAWRGDHPVSRNRSGPAVAIPVGRANPPDPAIRREAQSEP